MTSRATTPPANRWSNTQLSGGKTKTIRDSRTRECSEYINFGKLKMDHIQLALRLYHFILWSMFGIPAVPSHQPAPVSRQWTESEYWAACLHKKLNTCSVKTERIRSRHSINSVCQTQTRPSLPSLLSTIHNLIRIRKQQTRNRGLHHEEFRYMFYYIYMQNDYDERTIY